MGIDGWLTCKDGTHKKIGKNWVIVIPTGTAHSLETRENCEHELNIPCTPDGPPIHYIVAGESGPPDMTVGCGTLNVRYGEAIGLFDHLTEMLIIDMSEVPGDPDATIVKAQAIRRAASAPAHPSKQDRLVAAAASRMEAKARMEKIKQESEDEEADKINAESEIRNVDRTTEEKNQASGPAAAVYGIKGFESGRLLNKIV